MRINFVTEPSPGWVLRMMAENWSKFIPESTVSTLQPCLDSDINFYVNWDIFNKKTNIDIGWFTHREKDIKQKINFNFKAMKMDYCICPSQKTLDLLPAKKSTILKHGVGMEYIQKKNKIIFGVIGREYNSGRKNFKLIENLKTIPNSQFIISGGVLTKNEIVDLYKEIDYLLITSTNEGGPVPVLEAFTMGVPVIAPNVGWCWEYPVIKYSNTKELFKTINSLCSFVNVEEVWAKSSQELLKILKNIYEQKNNKTYKYS